MPPTYVPVFYSQTQYYPAYATPTYYPAASFGGRRSGAGYYNMGPSAAYISRVTGRNQADINQTITRNSNNFTRIHNVVPPSGVIDRHAYLRQIIPPALAQGQRLPPPRLAPNAKLAQVNLNRPNFVPAPRMYPDHRHYSPGPGRGATAGAGSAGHGVAHQGHHAPDPPDDQQIQSLPPPRHGVPATAPQPGPRPAQPGQAQPGQVHPGVAPKPGQVGAPTKPVQGNPAVRSNRENFTRVAVLGPQPPRLPRAATTTAPGAAPGKTPGAARVSRGLSTSRRSSPSRNPRRSHSIGLSRRSNPGLNRSRGISLSRRSSRGLSTSRRSSPSHNPRCSHSISLRSNPGLNHSRGPNPRCNPGRSRSRSRARNPKCSRSPGLSLSLRCSRASTAAAPSAPGGAALPPQPQQQQKQSQPQKKEEQKKQPGQP